MNLLLITLGSVVGTIGLYLALGKVPAADLSQELHPSNFGSGKWSW